MRKLLRLLLVAGSLLLLLHDARRSAVAQYCYTAPAVEQTPAGCCGPDEPINAITPCNTCTSPGGTEPRSLSEISPAAHQLNRDQSSLDRRFSSR
jgi:hypothetical protein